MCVLKLHEHNFTARVPLGEAYVILPRATMVRVFLLSVLRVHCVRLLAIYVTRRHPSEYVLVILRLGLLC